MTFGCRYRGRCQGWAVLLTPMNRSTRSRLQLQVARMPPQSVPYQSQPSLRAPPCLSTVPGYVVVCICGSSPTCYYSSTIPGVFLFCDSILQNCVEFLLRGENSLHGLSVLSPSPMCLHFYRTNLYHLLLKFIIQFSFIIQDLSD